MHFRSLERRCRCRRREDRRRFSKLSRVQQQQGLGGVQQMQVVGDGDIAEFMDLDRMEEGFSQGYGEQGGQF